MVFPEPKKHLPKDPLRPPPPENIKSLPFLKWQYLQGPPLVCVKPQFKPAGGWLPTLGSLWGKLLLSGLLASTGGELERGQ